MRFFSLLSFLVMLSGCSYNPMDPPPVKKGVMDLSAWNFQQQGLIALNGQWEFYWNELLKPEEFPRPETVKPGYLPVSGAWTGKRWAEEILPAHGYATYRAKIKLPAEDQLMGLYLSDQGTAYRLWLDGQLIAVNGTVGTNPQASRPQYLPQTVGFQATGRQVEVVIQVSNYDYRLGGLWYPLYLGTLQQVVGFQNRRLAGEFFLLGSLVIFMIYHLCLYLLRRQDRSPLYFSLFCLFIITRLLVTGEKLLSRWLPHFPWEILIKIEFLSFPLGVTLFVFFFFSLFPNKVLKSSLRPVSLIYLIFVLIILAFPARISSHSISALQLISLLVALLIIASAIYSIRKKQQGIIIYTLGALFVIAAFFHDILYARDIIRTGYLLPQGLFVFTFSQALLLSMRFARAFRLVEELNTSLEQMDRFKDEFLTNTSHELRTPISGIKAMAQLLLNTSLSQKQRKYVMLLRNSSTRLNQLVSDVMDLSRVKAGKLQLKQDYFDLREIVAAVVEIHAFQAAEKGLHLKYSFDQKIDTYLWGDSLRIGQILDNFISNSIKYTTQGYIEISAAIKREAGDEIFIEFIIRDTGIGIPESKRQEVFNPFSQLESSASDARQGLGLGLSITKRLTDIMGGTILLEENPGGGTCFRITIPFVKGELIPRAEETEVLPPPKNKGDIKALGKILVSEDDGINSLYLTEILQEQGFEVDVAANGREALEKIKGEAYDLILMDVNMPVLNGYEATRAIRAREGPDRHIPILAMTAYTFERDVQRCLDSGMDDYIAKPIDERVLLEKVRNYV